MISDNKFTLEEFNTKVKDFAQAFINKINKPGVTLELKQESPVSYLIIVNKPTGNESYLISLDQNGQVNTISVYGK